MRLAVESPAPRAESPAPRAQSPAPSAEAIVRAAVERYAGRIALACSFGGPSGMVLLDLALRVEPGLPVHYVDTGLLFPQTHALVARAARRYGIEPIAVRPALSVDEQAQWLGPALWERDPDRCCDLRKVRPHRAFLGGYDAWLTGIRRAQSATRREIEPVAPDGAALVKISPLFDWSDEDVWSYAIEHDVPVNALHAQGYPSIGCGPCTRAVAPGEDARAGRWASFAKTECGLHQRAEARG